ncbi:MAG: hypothetical protein NTY90_00535 [Candidatus Micrarchaeota archaeon]|nr:hypothetical protein [Candidatus Micrarchaeota archaeon]
MLKEIHRLSRQEENKARKWLKESGGKAYVLVHPHISSALPLEKFHQYAMIFYPMKGDVLPTAPVFLFEEKEKMPDLIKSIKAEENPEDHERRRNLILNRTGFINFLGPRWGLAGRIHFPWRPRRHIILVPTEKDDPTPVKESWNSLTDRMKRLGVKELFVSGKFLQAFEQRDLENRLDALSDEKPGAAALISQEFARAKQAVALERKNREKILKELERKVAKNGAKDADKSREKFRIEVMKLDLKQDAGVVYGKCVGKTHQELTLSKKFKDVKLLDGDSIWSY